jgi:hypothetical protein
MDDSSTKTGLDFVLDSLGDMGGVVVCEDELFTDWDNVTKYAGLYIPHGTNAGP